MIENQDRGTNDPFHEGRIIDRERAIIGARRVNAEDHLNVRGGSYLRSTADSMDGLMRHQAAKAARIRDREGPRRGRLAGIWRRLARVLTCGPLARSAESDPDGFGVMMM
jgi:hypothetical protein